MHDTPLMMNEPREAGLRTLMHNLDGRAAGLWLRKGEHLHRLALVFADSSKAAVFEEFARATEVVALNQGALNIVQAVVAAQPVIAETRTWPKHEGSGLWLLRFGAACSVAVPLIEEGHAIGVLSVALTAEPDDVWPIVEHVREQGCAILDMSPVDS